jgi:hypothetical protein
MVRLTPSNSKSHRLVLFLTQVAKLANNHQM